MAGKLPDPMRISKALWDEIRQYAGEPHGGEHEVFVGKWAHLSGVRVIVEEDPQKRNVHWVDGQLIVMAKSLHELNEEFGPEPVTPDEIFDAGMSGKIEGSFPPLQQTPARPKWEPSQNCYCGGPEETYPHKRGTGHYCRRSP